MPLPRNMISSSSNTSQARISCSLVSASSSSVLVRSSRDSELSPPRKAGGGNGGGGVNIGGGIYLLACGDSGGGALRNQNICPTRSELYLCLNKIGGFARWLGVFAFDQRVCGSTCGVTCLRRIVALNSGIQPLSSRETWSAHSARLHAFSANLTLFSLLRQLFPAVAPENERTQCRPETNGAKKASSDEVVRNQRPWLPFA